MIRPARDKELIQIVDAALADASARAGNWLVCHPGCTPCCHGVFVISALDAARLQDGLGALAAEDPARATAVRERVRRAVEDLTPNYPGNPRTGALGSTPEEEARFEDFGNEEPCPVLSPETGTCDLYAYRPMTCRVFGPPVPSEDGIGHCELCFRGATQEQVEAAEMQLAFSDFEEELVGEAIHVNGAVSRNIVAFALAGH